MTPPAVDKESLFAAITGAPIAVREMAAPFGVSRQAIHHHLRQLRDDGLVEQVGAGRAARWRRTVTAAFRWPLSPESPGEDEMWRQAQEHLGERLEVSTETAGCLRFGVTEMLNNAIDHSDGTEATLSVTVGKTIEVVVADDGVGAYRRVQAHYDLPGPLDAVAHIAKGRQTTAPSHHSGQGIFFTSKVVDQFHLDANGVIWKVDRTRDDATVAPGAERPGTRVLLRTAANGTRTTKSVFDRFTEPDELRFDRTRIHVQLSKTGDTFVSRSEAKRLAAGLEGFSIVELDFAGVTEVGQGFVDELLRVWSAEHPEIQLSPLNMSAEVAFMVERGLPRPG